MLRLTVDEFDDLDDVEQFEPVQPPGDDGGIGSIIGGLGDGVNAPPGGVSYLSDPWGNTFEMLRDAAAGLSRDVLPALTDATLPDLSADWFIGAYRVSFATAIFVAVALLFPQFVRTARGRQSGRELVDSLGLYFGAFLLGATFGPAAGLMLVAFFTSLSDVFVSWGVQDSVDTVVDRFQAMITEADPAAMAGGMPIAVLVMLGMLIGLFLVLLMLVMQSRSAWSGSSTRRGAPSGCGSSACGSASSPPSRCSSSSSASPSR
jgi:type IV secretion system protein TrbL